MDTCWFLFTAGPAEVGSAERGPDTRPTGRAASLYACSGPSAISVRGWVIEPMNFHHFTTSNSEAASFRSAGYREESSDAFRACPASTPGVVPV